MHCFTLFTLGLAILVPIAAAADCPDGTGSSTCNGMDMCCNGILQCNDGETAACLTGCKMAKADCYPLCEDSNDQTTSGACTTIPITATDYSHQVYGSKTTSIGSYATSSYSYYSSSAAYASSSAATTTTTMSSTETMTMIMTSGSGSETAESTLTSTSAATGGNGGSSSGSGSSNNSPTAKPGAGTSTSTNASISKAAAVAMVTEAPVMAFAAVLAGAVLL